MLTYSDVIKVLGSALLTILLRLFAQDWEMVVLLWVVLAIQLVVRVWVEAVKTRTWTWQPLRSFFAKVFVYGIGLLILAGISNKLEALSWLYALLIGVCITIEGLWKTLPLLGEEFVLVQQLERLRNEITRRSSALPPSDDEIPGPGPVGPIEPG